MRAAETGMRIRTSGSSSAPTADITATSATASATGRRSATAMRTDTRTPTTATPVTAVTRPGRNTGPYGVQSGQGPYAQRSPYGVYGGSTSVYYNSPAFDNGVREGFEKGQEDARKGRSYDILRHEWYRDGDRHYENRYGSRQQYKDIYRRGFQQGYEEGFRDWRYRQ